MGNRCYPGESSKNNKVGKKSQEYLASSKEEGKSAVREDSGVTSGQVKAPKYIVLRNVTTASFTWYICFFHGNAMPFGPLEVVSTTTWDYLIPSIAYKRTRKQAPLQYHGSPQDIASKMHRA